MSAFSPLERLLLPLVRRFVALWVRPSVLPDLPAASFTPGRPVVYALEKRSLVDVAVLEYVCRELQLPLPLVSFGTGPVLPISVLFHRSADVDEPIVETHAHPSSVSLEERLRDVE